MGSSHRWCTLGGFNMDANGYVMIFMPQHHRANSWGVVYEHIIKAEEMLSRALKDEEVVHHRDGNRANNNYNNLLVFHTKSEHTRFHKLNDTSVKFLICVQYGQTCASGYILIILPFFT